MRGGEGGGWFQILMVINGKRKLYSRLGAWVAAKLSQIGLEALHHQSVPGVERSLNPDVNHPKS